jgi:hypothetical protein
MYVQLCHVLRESPSEMSATRMHSLCTAVPICEVQYTTQDVREGFQASSGCSTQMTKEVPVNLQHVARNDTVFDLVLII